MRTPKVSKPFCNCRQHVNNQYSIYPVTNSYYNASSNLTLSGDKKILYYKGADGNLWYYFTDQESTAPNWNRQALMYGNPIQGPLASIGSDNSFLLYVDNYGQLDWVIATNGDNPVRCQYEVNSTDQNNYKSDTFSVKTDTTRVDTANMSRKTLNDSSLQVMAYPNPSENSFTLVINGYYNSNTIIDLKIHDMEGQSVYAIQGNMSIGNNLYTFLWDATGASNGIYFYTIKTGNGMVLTGKLVKM